MFNNCIFLLNKIRLNLVLMFQLRATQVLPIAPPRAWVFLSDPRNLEKMTPAHMGFQILSGADRPMFPGQVIEYTVAPFPGIKTRWVTEISHVSEGQYFVDEQRFGPYAFWHHKHFLHPDRDGVLMEDVIDYKLPLGGLGRLFHEPLVKKQLEQIFQYRASKIQELFGSVEGREITLEIKKI